jgi:hypothetical protein
VKLLRLAVIPAVLAITVLSAVPALAHEVKEFKIAVVCKTDTGQICVKVQGMAEDLPKDSPAGRTIVLALFGVDKAGKATDLQNMVNIPLGNGSVNQTACFKAVTSGDFDHFVIKWQKTLEGPDHLKDLVISEMVKDSYGKDKKVDLEEGAVVVKKVQSCTAAATSPAATATASASAARTAVLASTGGFDFRFPLIAAALLVVGVSLLLVSVARGRSAG